MPLHRRPLPAPLAPGPRPRAARWRTLEGFLASAAVSGRGLTTIAPAAADASGDIDATDDAGGGSTIGKPTWCGSIASPGSGRSRIGTLIPRDSAATIDAADT